MLLENYPNINETKIFQNNQPIVKHIKTS